MIEEDLDKQQRRQTLKPCLFCSEPCNMENHILGCPGVTPDTVIVKPSFIRIDGRGNICKHCWCLFQQKDWQYHRKSQICRRKDYSYHQRDFSQRQGYISMKSMPEHQPSHSQIIKERFLSDGHHNSVAIDREVDDHHTQEKDNRQMTAIANAILAPLIRQWVKRNQHIEKNVLVVYLTSAVVQFGTSFLTSPIAVPTWEAIQKKAGKNTNLRSFLEKPQNLFNDRFIDIKLQRLVIRKQIKVIKGLNRLCELYKGLVKKRDVPSLNRVPRLRGFINMRDILLVIKDLLSSKKKRLVHLALDLYIILLSGQRFLADQKRIEAGVLDLLANNQGKEESSMVLTFSMIIGKTNQRQEVCLNKQLILMLQQFKWNGFHSKTQRLVRRMNEWLGIYGYALKDTMLTAIAAVASDLHLSQRAAGHRSIMNTLRYTRTTIISDSLKVTSKIIVPGADFRFGRYDDQQIMQYLNSMVVDNIRYTEVKSDWMQLLLPRLYTSRYHHQLQADICIDFMKPDPAPLHSQLQNQSRVLRQLQELNQDIDHEELVMEDIDNIIEQMSLDKITIYGSEIKIRFLQSDKPSNLQFIQQNFFVTTLGYDRLDCEGCSRSILSAQTRFQCVYCEGDYHVACAKIICRCTQPQNLEYPIIPVLHRPISIQEPTNPIYMPLSYLRPETKQQKFIKILLAIRRFRYTRAAICLPGYSVDFSPQYWKGAEWIDLPLFKSYLSGQYFPPIEALPINDYQPHPVYGVEWGIFATQQIGQRVLIGQYGCDLIGAKDLILCKKHDSIMGYCKGNSSQIYLAPKDYAGYVLLINTSQPKNCNCLALKYVVENSLRVLLITNRLIRKGEQLSYSYGSHFKFRIKKNK